MSASAAVAVRSAATIAIRPTLAKVSFFIRQSPRTHADGTSEQPLRPQDMARGNGRVRLRRVKGGRELLKQQPPLKPPDSPAIDLTYMFLSTFLSPPPPR